MNNNAGNFIEVQATISRLELDPESVADQDSGYRYRPVYKYQLNGQTYEARRNIYDANMRKEGETYAILIDPANPHTYRYKHDLYSGDTQPVSDNVAKPEKVVFLGVPYYKVSCKCINVYESSESKRAARFFNAEFEYEIEGVKYSTKSLLDFSYSEESIAIPLVGRVYDLYVSEDDPQDIFFPQPDRKYAGINDLKVLPNGDLQVTKGMKNIIAGIGLMLAMIFAIPIYQNFSIDKTELEMTTVVILGVPLAIVIAVAIFLFQNNMAPKMANQTPKMIEVPFNKTNLKIIESGGQSAIQMSSFDISYEINGKTYNTKVKTKTPLGYKSLARLKLRVDPEKPKKYHIEGIEQ